MKTRFLMSLLAVLLLASFTMAQQLPHYTVTDLGTLGGTFSLAFAINDRGQVDGFSTLPGDTAVHSFLYKNGTMIDLGTLGGPDSESLSGLNNMTQVGGSAETAISDPNGEDFCGFGTYLTCLGFVWQNEVLTPLPTLGGNNAQVAIVNARGQVAGYAENSTSDPNCPAPQVLQFKPTVWTGGHARALPTYPGDAEGAAFWMNDRGDVVGASGYCSPFDPRYGAPLQPTHALLWQKGAVMIDVGNLGGAFNNGGFAINNLGQVVGASDIVGDQYQHAFFWQKGVMTDMGTLPGDVVSAAVAINDRGQATGVSIDADGNIRGFLWQNGVMVDLNSLIPPDSPWYVLHGFGINSAGELVGIAYNISTGEVHGILAVPTSGPTYITSGAQAGRAKYALPEIARRQLEQLLRVRRFVP